MPSPGTTISNPETAFQSRTAASRGTGTRSRRPATQVGVQGLRSLSPRRDLQSGDCNTKPLDGDSTARAHDLKRGDWHSESRDGDSLSRAHDLDPWTTTRSRGPKTRDPGTSVSR